MTEHDAGAVHDHVSVRLERVVAELKMRRRRLDAYHRAPDWPGKDPAWKSELLGYDMLLQLAASMLEVAVPAHDGDLFAPEVRALVEDRLSLAGLDVWAPRVIRDSGCY